MKCPDLEIFDDYLLGLLSAETSADLEAHLTVCPKCRALLEKERRLDEWFRRWEPIPAPPGFFRNVMSSLEKKHAPRTLPDWIWATGIGFFVAYIGIFIGKLSNTLTPTIIARLRSFLAGIGSQITLDWVTHEDWVARLTGGNTLLIVNLSVAGIIFCWGLWQVVKTLRR
jgi:anti-sigma factor RsiW